MRAIECYLIDFIDSYIECALRVTTNDLHEDYNEHNGSGPSLDQDYEIDDLDSESLEKIKSECRTFVQKNWHLLQDLDAEQCGHDFWLSRGQYGSGFCDAYHPDNPNLQQVFDYLHKVATNQRERHLYLGDDNRIYQYE